MEASRGPFNTKVRNQSRAARSCELCRLKKTKCDEGSPCTYCRVRNKNCIYRTADKPRRTLYSSDYVRQLERQVQALSAPNRLPSEAGFESPGPSHDGLPARYQTNYILDSASRSISSPKIKQNHNVDTLATATSSHSHDAAAPKEVSAINHHTNNVEFYGSSSSMSLLSRVQGDQDNSAQTQNSNGNDVSLVSELHNPSFFASPPADDSMDGLLSHNQSHSQQHRVFLNGFFRSIHYIHPILDKSAFLLRCEKLWEDGPSSQTRSFMALYYSLLSLGALVGPRDEETPSTVSNLDCSRSLFNTAHALCSELSMTTDLEMVQCFLFMAKICQNELNPHLSYMYTGLAVRTALAMGINREPPPESKKSFELLKAESRTWWGLYSLETEMSFSMGRPDTLGVDLYHNRQYPQIQDESPSTPPSSTALNPEMSEPPLLAIIKCMVDFSRITRTVCLGLYMSASPPQRNLSLASRIEQDLDNWLDKLPGCIRPSRTYEIERSLKYVKDAQWMKRQRLVLSIRYHNVRMLLFASFLTAAASVEEQSPSLYKENISKCLESAKETIKIIYETYRHHNFFRTWFYNTTYTLFAVSIILVYIMQEASESEKNSLFGYVEMSIEILETMDDCIVAKKAAKMIQRATMRAKDNTTGENANEEHNDTTMRDMASATFNSFWGPLNLMDGEIDVTFPFELGDLDEDGNYGDLTTFRTFPSYR